MKWLSTSKEKFSGQAARAWS